MLEINIPCLVIFLMLIVLIFLLIGYVNTFKNNYCDVYKTKKQELQEQEINK